MKKMLMTATVASMIGQFNMNNIQILLESGYQVHVACDFHDRSVWTAQRIKAFIQQMKDMCIPCHQIDYARNPLKINKTTKAYHQMCKLLKKERFDFIHCHTPVAGVISRMAAHKYHVKVIYTAHGFHFYDGAPIKNWLLYYPVEKFFSRWTDVLITITKEDYQRAKEKFHAKNVVYVPGIGVKIDKFRDVEIDRQAMRTALGMNSKEDILLLSVGELNDNKNHITVIEAIGKMENQHIHYCIAGTGALHDKLLQKAKEYGLENKVHLLGYRTDIPQLLKTADIYILPSIREGLNVSLMEAMASGLPCICGNIRGNTDLIEDNKGGFLFKPKSVSEAKDCIQKILCTDRTRMEIVNRSKVIKFSSDDVNQKMTQVYKNIRSEEYK